MQCTEISISAHPEAVETLSEVLAEITGAGISIETPYTLEDDGQQWRSIPDASVTVHAYLPNNPETNSQTAVLLQRIREVLWHLSTIGERYIGELQVNIVEDEDWAETWKDYFHVTPIGRRTVIKPTWRDYQPDRSDIAVIELDPGMAFGTGTHPTTRLCLMAIEDYVQAGDTVLDVGTGSGILAIAAVKLGAGHTIGIDISQVSVEVATQNVALNHVSDVIEIAQGTVGLGPQGELLLTPASIAADDDIAQLLSTIRILSPANMVIANIIARVIGELAETLVAALAPSGILIASGIIVERASEAIAPLQKAGLDIIEQRQEGDWLAIIGKKVV